MQADWKTRFAGRVLTAIAAVALSANWGLSEARAASVMPDFSGVPAGWTTDRYDPDSFTNVGTFEGRNNVLGIGIGTAGAFNNRAPGYQSTFYDTQGRGHDISAGAGSVLSADLWVPTSWRDESNGARRTDMWGVASNGTTVTDYPIIGFTNDGGAARFRIWEENTGSWIDLTDAVKFDGWNALSITFTGSEYIYSVNGSAAYTDSTVNGSTEIDRVLMQGYNFEGDPAFTVTANPYTAYWANTAVPEPGSLSLLCLPVVGLYLLRRRKA